MLIRFGYEITIACWQPTPVVLQLSPREERAGDLVRPERFTTDPSLQTSFYRDMFGNGCRRLIAPAGDLTLRADNLIHDSGALDAADPNAVQHDVADLPDDCLIYLMGSRYCETDKLSQVAWDLFGHIEPGWERVQAVVDFVHNRIRFDYQQARATRTAFEAFEERVGVCRDFAHLAVTLCRSLNIPARYANGHLGDIGIAYNPDPMDFCAWMEVYLGGRWWTFDPRNNARRIGRVVLGYGRDAADVAMINSFGPHILKSFQVVTEEVSRAADAA